eukprot:1591624-Prymnesium_polylepis.1
MRVGRFVVLVVAVLFAAAAADDPCLTQSYAEKNCARRGSAFYMIRPKATVPSCKGYGSPGTGG